MDEETETDTKKKEKRIDLSVAQVAGSALAAAVAAYLAGRLGVYGTIIGAGVVSVVATTGGSVFQHLFRRTGEQLKEAKVVTRPKPRRFPLTRTHTHTDTGTGTGTGSLSASGAQAGEARRADPTMVLATFDRRGAEDEVTSVAARESGPGADRTQLIPRAGQAGGRGPSGAHPAPEGDDATRMLRAVDDDATRALRPVKAGGQERPADRTQLVPRLEERTQLVPRLDERTMALGQAAPGRTGATADVDAASGKAAAKAEGAEEEVEEVAHATYGTRLRGWKRPALGAFAVFVLAMGAVTATELITGQTSSGAPGTTLSHLTHPADTGRDQPDTPRSPDPRHSTGHGKDHGSGDEPSPDPSGSGRTGTGDGTDPGTRSPSPSPSDGGKTSPAPSTSPSTEPSPSGSAGTGDGGGDSTGSTGDDSQKNPDGQQVPDPGAS